MAPQAIAADRWTERRRRAAELQERWPFAAEVLTFYGALLGVQERVYEAAQAEVIDRLQMKPEPVAAYVAARALPLVREVTVARGPEKLARAAAGLSSPDRASAPAASPHANRAAGGREGEPGSPTRWEDTVRVWLGGGELPAVERYLVRAAAGPVLEAVGPAAGEVCSGPRDERHCPRCGGLPQVSIFTPTGEDLVAPRRFLECARCAWRWSYPRMTCAACGETETRHLPIFAEEGTTETEAAGTVIRGVGGTPAGTPPAAMPRFPHVGIHACTACSRYVLNIDLSRDARAVPVVDEMAAIPLDLYAREQGLTKIVPNLMGF